MECRNIGIQNINELPIDNLESIPDYFIGIRNFIDQASGSELSTFTKVPGAKVIPTGNLDNVFTLESNNPNFTVPDNQIVPAYVQNNGTSNVVLPADGAHPAQFVVVGTYGDLLLCQNCGVVNILAGSPYIVGAQYYRSNQAGQVTTNNALTGQPLFIGVSNTKILLNM